MKSPTTLIQKPSDPPEPMAPETGQALSWLGLRFAIGDQPWIVTRDVRDRRVTRIDRIEVASGGTRRTWTRRAFADALITGQVTWL
jgi:hypothetical protein